jgi:PAS domain S-box-containing protein
MPAVPLDAASLHSSRVVQASPSHPGTTSDMGTAGSPAPAVLSADQKLVQFLEVSGAGTWSWEAHDNSEVWDAKFRRQFGFAPDEPATFEGWLGRIHPDDRVALLDRIAEMMNHPGEDRWDAEFRIQLPDGEVRWMHGFGQAERDSEGRLLGVRGVNFDVTDTRLAWEKVRQSEANLRVAAEVAALGMMEIHYGSGLVFPDERAAVLFGLAPGVGVSRTTVHSRFHPEDRDAIFERVRNSLDPEGSGTFAMEHRVRHPDGTVAWLHVRKQVTFETRDGARRPVSGLLVAIDVTERREAEERRLLVTQEVAHRSKNLLALVQAVARQAALPTDHGFVDRLEARLKALSVNQDVLLLGEAGDVDLETLVRRQLGHFQSLLDVRIRLNGPSLRLGEAAAQTLGLVLHELATNAGKYGSLSAHEGRIQIDWQIDGDDFHLTWQESGGPPVAAPSRKGFGTLVVERMVRQSFEAEVRLDYALQGFSWHLSCPLARLR